MDNKLVAIPNDYRFTDSVDEIVGWKVSTLLVWNYPRLSRFNISAEGF